MFGFNLSKAGRDFAFMALIATAPAAAEVRVITEITLPLGRTDGIFSLPEGALLVASQDGHAVYRVPVKGKPVIIASDIPAPAAIGIDTKRNRMVVPQIVAGTLTFVDLLHPERPITTPVLYQYQTLPFCELFGATVD